MEQLSLILTKLPTGVSVAKPRASGSLRERTSALPRLAVAAGFVLVAAATGFVTGRAPLLSLGAAAAAVIVGLALHHFLAAMGILTVSFFLDGYLSPGGQDLLTPAKAIGLLAALVWALEWARGQRRARWDPALAVIAAFALWMFVASSAAQDTRSAVIVGTRYLSFIGLFFLMLQAVDGSHNRARTLACMAVAGAALSGLIGTFLFLAGLTDRASGPLPDANDFGVLLASVVPLALVTVELATTRSRRLLARVAVVVLLTAILASFSRSAFLGLVVAGAWAWGTGRLRLRGIMLVLGCVALVCLISLELWHEQVTLGFDRKSDVAAANVESRFATWNIAVRAFSSSPVFGVGPGNILWRSLEFEDRPSRFIHGRFVTHNAYLSMLAELGLPGATLFVAFLVTAWARLRQRLPDPDADRLQSAVAAGFLVAVVGAFFLDEQYYMQLWFLSALGATLPAARLSRVGVMVTR